MAARRIMRAIPEARGSDGGLAPILHVTNARASVDWYARLGFEVESEHAFGPDWPLYVRLRRGPAQLHLSEHRLDGNVVHIGSSLPRRKPAAHA
jgi:glyoxalase superfamily protein